MGTNPYDWEGEIWTQTHIVKTQGEDGCLQTRERGPEQILPSRPSEGTKPAHTLISDFQTPGLQENEFLLFKPSSLRYFVTAALANEDSSLPAWMHVKFRATSENL